MASAASRELFHDQLADICDQAGVQKHDAFPRWICRNVLGITDEGKIDEAVSIGGKGDYGVDVFYAEDGEDPTEQYICWIQAKFSQELNHVINREEIESFAGTATYLANCPDGANSTFKQKSAEFVKMSEKNPRVRMRMIFAAAGRPNSQVAELVDDPRWRKSRLGSASENAQIEILDLDSLLSHMVIPHTPPLSVEFDGQVIERRDPVTGQKSAIGYVRADSLVSLAKDHKETLFLENPRQSLGKSAPTHRAILNTLGDGRMRKKFWKLNNGITAICDSLERTGGSRYRVEDFKIVNGRQTTYTLESSVDRIDDVFLLMTLHEAVDDEERNQISAATNTQNPIRPVDLVTNYPEIRDLAVQCRKDFPEFYFERQSGGFASEGRATRNRVTGRRVMEKGPIARAYYAYAISPADATMPDKVLFSATGDPRHYEAVFKGRDIRDLIIPHILMQSLDELHRKWCRELRERPSDEASRRKGIISKDVIKYYILRFVYESMTGMDGSVTGQVRQGIIDRFRGIKNGEPMPQGFLDLAQDAYDVFMTSFDLDRDHTWPADLLKKVNDPGRAEQAGDVPTPYEMASVLRERGGRLLPHLLRTRRHVITQTKADNVMDRLLELGGAAH